MIADARTYPHDEAVPDIRVQLVAVLHRGYVAAFRFLGNAEDAAEALQEAAAKALGAGDRYDPARPFYPWFYKILKNHCLNKKARRKPSEPLDNNPVAASGASAEEQVLHSEKRGHIEQALDVLSEEHREILDLRHFQDLGYEEIAEILQCPVGTVMSRLYRARKALRSQLEDMGFFGDKSGKGGQP
jgi:RNA polymerase sigma-70 factor (ECF subfamily)